MIRVSIDRRGRVNLAASETLPITAHAAWAYMRRFPEFTTHDAFHARVHVHGDPSRIGTTIVIRHSYFGVRLWRIGRVLMWREGVGYAFSDLSLRGGNVGFPHIYHYTLTPCGDGSCQLTLSVRGKWTARTIPRFFVRVWLRWVMLLSMQRMRNDLLRQELRRAGKQEMKTAH